MATVERSFRRNSSWRGHFAIGCCHQVKFRPSHEGLVAVWLGNSKERENVNVRGVVRGKKEMACEARKREEVGEKGGFWKKELSGVDDREGERGEIILPAGFSISLLGCSSMAAFNDRHRGHPSCHPTKSPQRRRGPGRGREECSGRLN